MIKTDRITNEVDAPAKIILAGEHAVVYGCPAIALPVNSLRAIATFTPHKNDEYSGLRIIAEDLERGLPIDLSNAVDDALALTAKLTLEYVKHLAPNVTINLRSQIPMASGLGSGAAVSTALVRALCSALDIHLSDAEINAIVYEVEKIHHGTPSGIDNTVIVYRKPIYFVREHPIETFNVGAPFTFLIADTGHSALTRIAVGAVRDLFNADQARIQPIFDEISVLVADARSTIEMGDQATLGKLMNRNHELLNLLTVSSPELDTLVNAALNAGAIGAKLSGGGRGGNMIALVTPQTQEIVHQALLSAGAKTVFATTLQPSTV